MQAEAADDATNCGQISTPARDEPMYWVQCIPVHGQPFHLRQHQFPASTWNTVVKARLKNRLVFRGTSELCQPLDYGMLQPY
eukprot:scaffold22577_cov122-Cylindrotheca_fusiformis.AAC.8